jgi:hypothetical protein
LVALARTGLRFPRLDAADTTTGRGYARYVATGVVRNATIGRQLGRLLHDARFHVESADATAVLFRDHDGAETTLRMPAVAQRARHAGALDEQATRALLADPTTGPSWPPSRSSPRTPPASRSGPPRHQLTVLRVGG